MTFKMDWHPYSVAELWPPGSVVLVRMKMTSPAYNGRHAYFVVSNWQPKLQAFGSPRNEFVLLEEANK